MVDRIRCPYCGNTDPAVTTDNGMAGDRLVFLCLAQVHPGEEDSFGSLALSLQEPLLCGQQYSLADAREGTEDEE